MTPDPFSSHELGGVWARDYSGVAIPNGVAKVTDDAGLGVCFPTIIFFFFFAFRPTQVAISYGMYFASKFNGLKFNSDSEPIGNQ